MQKERKKKDSIQKRKEQIHMLLKARSSLKKKKAQIQIHIIENEEEKLGIVFNRKR